MNRRKALRMLAGGGISIVAAAGAYKWYSIMKRPDLLFLTGHIDLIKCLADTIIPPTDSPGAADASVHEFIVKIISECADRKTQNNFIEGLKDLQSYCIFNFGRPYQVCTLDEKDSVLKHFGKNAKAYPGIVGKAYRKYLGDSFFTILKQYTVEGYCTSRAGAMQALVYDNIPGSYHGCISLKQGQRAWAIN